MFCSHAYNFSKIWGGGGIFQIDLFSGSHVQKIGENATFSIFFILGEGEIPLFLSGSTTESPLVVSSPLNSRVMFVHTRWLASGDIILLLWFMTCMGMFHRILHTRM